MGRERLWQPAQRDIEDAIRTGVPDQLARDAMLWRIGNSYYSFLRELFVIAALRERGVDLRCHPLADALFRVDCWFDRNVISLYIGNATYRDGVAGRKLDPRVLLGDAQPPFRFREIRVGTPRRFGVVHLPDLESLMRAVDLW